VNDREKQREEAQRARWRREQRIRRRAISQLIEENPQRYEKLAQDARKEDS